MKTFHTLRCFQCLVIDTTADESQPHHAEEFAGMHSITTFKACTALQVSSSMDPDADNSLVNRGGLSF